MKLLKQIGLTLDEEEQRLVKRKVLQICLELQDMRDCLVEGARNILSIQEINLYYDPNCLLSDPSVRFFGLEWKPVFSTCKKIYQDMVIFWAHLVEENTVDCRLLRKTFAALDKLENDVGNHGLAVLETRFSSAGTMVEQNQDTRRNSCHQYKIKHEETKSSKRSLSWKGIGAKKHIALLVGLVTKNPVLGLEENLIEV